MLLSYSWIQISQVLKKHGLGGYDEWITAAAPLLCVWILNTKPQGSADEVDVKQNATEFSHEYAQYKASENWTDDWVASLRRISKFARSSSHTNLHLWVGWFAYSYNTYQYDSTIHKEPKMF